MNRSNSVLAIAFTIGLLCLPLVLLDDYLSAAPPKMAPIAGDSVLTAVDVSAYLDGDYVMTLKAGAVTIRPFKLLTPGNPPPGPAPNPNPSPLNPRATLFKDAALKVSQTQDPDRVNTAKALAFLYRSLAQNVKDGKITDAPTLKLVVSRASDLLLKKPSDKATAWQPVRDLLGTQWTTLDAAPGGSPVSSYAALLDDCANGLDASAPGKAISPEMIQLILQIIEIIMKLFFPT